MIKQPQPPGFKEHTYKFTFQFEGKESHVWQWLNDTRTFTDTQVWPWKVEFYSPDPDKIPNGFHQGVLTNHFGPFINLAGELTEINNGKYRDLQYFYGSYVISFRWIRPCRLEFGTEQEGDIIYVTGVLKSYVKSSVSGMWTTFQKIFWHRFGNWAKKSIGDISKEASPNLKNR